MKMKKTDIAVVAFMYAVCALFFAMSMELKPESRYYPWFTIALLAGLTTLYLVRMLIAGKRFGMESGMEEFVGFIPRQFAVVCGATLAYLVLMYLAGFYISTALFMVSMMLFFHIPKRYIALTTILVMGTVYFAFTGFLGVRLPLGILFG